MRSYNFILLSFSKGIGVALAEAQIAPSWQVETLRLTAFPTSGLLNPEPNWWEKVIGEPPEVKTFQRPNILHEHGSIRAGYCNLALDSQPGRIDWVMNMVLRPGQELDNFPTFGPLDKGLRVFRELLFPWLPECPQLKRLAVGAVLIMPAENVRDGYKKIAKFLPAVNLDSENSSDFSYSINRPRTNHSVIQGLKINRLSKWGVVKLNGIFLQIANPPGTISMVQSKRELPGCRLEIDVNTDAEYSGSISSSQTAMLLEDLTKMAEEIAIKGDIP